MGSSGTLIGINRAPGLILWATVLAERLGSPSGTAFSFASRVAGLP